MAPAADQSARLLFLQGKVAALRVEHEGLVERLRILRAAKHTASAVHMKAKADRVFSEFQAASKELADFLSRRARRAVKDKP